MALALFVELDLYLHALSEIHDGGFGARAKSANDPNPITDIERSAPEGARPPLVAFAVAIRPD